MHSSDYRVHLLWAWNIRKPDQNHTPVHLYIVHINLSFPDEVHIPVIQLRWANKVKSLCTPCNHVTWHDYNVQRDMTSWLCKLVSINLYSFFCRVYLHGGIPSSHALSDMQDWGAEKGTCLWRMYMYRFVLSMFVGLHGMCFSQWLHLLSCACTLHVHVISHVYMSTWLFHCYKCMCSAPWLVLLLFTTSHHFSTKVITENQLTPLPTYKKNT